MTPRAVLTGDLSPGRVICPCQIGRGVEARQTPGALLLPVLSPESVDRLGVGLATLHCKTNCSYRNINSRNNNGTSPGKGRACSSGNYDVRESKPNGSFRTDDPCEYQDNYQDWRMECENNV